MQPGNYVQFGQHILPMECLGPINLHQKRSQAQGGGTVVRVWLRNTATQEAGVPTDAPLYLDFEGTEATIIRQNVQHMSRTPGLTVFLENAQETAGASSR